MRNHKEFEVATQKHIWYEEKQWLESVVLLIYSTEFTLTYIYMDTLTYIYMELHL